MLLHAKFLFIFLSSEGKSCANESNKITGQEKIIHFGIS